MHFFYTKISTCARIMEKKVAGSELLMIQSLSHVMALCMASNGTGSQVFIDDTIKDRLGNVDWTMTHKQSAKETQKFLKAN